MLDFFFFFESQAVSNAANIIDERILDQNGNQITFGELIRKTLPSKTINTAATSTIPSTMSVSIRDNQSLSKRQLKTANFITKNINNNNNINNAEIELIRCGDEIWNATKQTIQFQVLLSDNSNLSQSSVRPSFSRSPSKIYAKNESIVLDDGFDRIAKIPSSSSCKYLPGTERINRIDPNQSSIENSDPISNDCINDENDSQNLEDKAIAALQIISDYSPEWCYVEGIEQ